MDRAAFNIYVETQLAPTLRPGDIVILDNLSVHKSSVSGFSKAKRRLELEIRIACAEEAARLGVEPVEIPHWTIHDLRTTFNTLACDVLEIDAHVADPFSITWRPPRPRRSCGFTTGPSSSSRAREGWQTSPVLWSARSSSRSVNVTTSDRGQ
jgi:hypothetical protein